MSVTVTSRIPMVRARVRSAVAGAVEKAMLDVEAAAKTSAPVDTGALRNSIQGERTGEFSGIVAPNVDYAIYVELGTRHMSAQPFLTPAADEVRPAFEAAVARAVRL